MCISFHMHILLMTLFLIQIVYMNENIVCFFMHNRQCCSTVSSISADIEVVRLSQLLQIL